MSATEGLRKEHDALRGLLDALELQLQLAPSEIGALRMLCISLMRMLKDHIDEEEDVMAGHASRVPAGIRHRILGEHADEWLMLHELSALFSAKAKLPAGEVAARLTRVIGELRAHMFEEEREIFDAVDAAEWRSTEPALAAAGG
jgi:hypothetical protein